MEIATKVNCLVKQCISKYTSQMMKKAGRDSWSTVVLHSLHYLPFYAEAQWANCRKTRTRALHDLSRPNEDLAEPF